MQMATKEEKAKAAEFRAKLEGETADPRWIERAIVAIFEYQTNHEQRVESTEDHNGVGFTGADAFILSSFAKQINAKAGRDVPSGQRLSEKQLAIAERKMGKYAGQLVRIVNQRQVKPN